MVVGEVARPVGVLVVGGGPGGYTAAARAAELGKEVVLVEAERIGGVCLHSGCIPSTAIVTAARDFERAGALAGHGILADPRLDWQQVQTWKQSVVDRLQRGVMQLLKGVEVVFGTGRLLDAHRVVVESGDQVNYFRFEHAVLATGSRPVAPRGLVFDATQVVDAGAALTFDRIPTKLTVVGAGYIGAQLAIAYAKLGARVVLLESAERVLPEFDAELVREVDKTLARLGVDVRTRTTAVGMDGEVLLVECPQGGERVESETVLVTGRLPNTGELQLAEAGVAVTADGHLHVDEQQRTNVPSIFAVGDLTAGPSLAHKAMEQGRVAAEVIAGLPSGFDQTVPRTAYTDPELAAVGLTEAQAEQQARGVVIGRARFAASGRGATLGEPTGLVKVVADAASGVVLGVQLAGPSATELVAEAALAVEMASRAEDLARTLHAHPTLGESLADAARAVTRSLEADGRGERQ